MLQKTLGKRILGLVVCVALGFSLNACAEKNTEPVQPEEPDTTATIEDVLAAEVGSEFEVGNATVVASNLQGMVLRKKEAEIYAFYGEPHGMKVGDVVTIKGTTESRNGLVQFGKGCTIEKTGEKSVSQPKPSKFTATEIEAYMKAPEIKYVTLDGTIMVAGNYVNVEIDGTSVIGSLDYMSDDFKAKYNMHTVTIEGWLFGSYKTYLYMVPVSIKDGGEFEETVPEGAIYFNSFDKEIAVQDAEKYQTSKGWPFCEQFDGWKNEKGSGAADVTYDFKSISPRTNQSSKGSLSQYDGSGKNNLLFSTAPNYFTIQKIAIPATKLRLSFGAQRYSQGATNTFYTSDFVVTLSADGETWSPAIDYDFAGVSDIEGNWRRAVADFTLPEEIKTLYIRFEAKLSSVNRIDDVLLTEGEGGQAIEFGKVVETPLITVAEATKAEIGKMFKVNGKVVCTHTKGFLVQDETGTILVFKKKHGMVAGNLVTVEGTIATYGGLNQFGESSVITVNGTEDVKHPEPEVFTAAEFDGYAAKPCIKYVKYSGTMKSTQDQYWQWHNNIIVEGTDVQGSVAYPDSSFGLKNFENGTEVEVVGYAIGVSGSDVKYLNTMITAIKAVE